jgi:nickel-dependent lactate racemase
VKIEVPYESGPIAAELPDGSVTLRMRVEKALSDPGAAIRAALAAPIGGEPLRIIARRKNKQGARACIVVSDKTRPVPYRGPGGLLLPILEVLFAEGFSARDLTILVASGMHSLMSREELELMLGTEPFDKGVEVQNHDCRDRASLSLVGVSARGTEAWINRRYIDADLKIVTGLVESHFMAGASGGRKAVCPGIMGEDGTRIFHGAALMSHPETRDLRLEGNPVHEESLAVATMAGVDFMANVTVDSRFAVTGVFCGDLEKAHAAAVGHLRDSVGIAVERPFDLVVTHGGFVAQNHYQAAKAGVAALGALASSGSGLILVADNRDAEPIGSAGYRALLPLLKTIGPIAFDRLLASPEWTFIPDQWEVQMWAKVFKKIAMDDFVYFAPQLSQADAQILPGVDGRSFLPPGPTREAALEVPEMIAKAVARFLSRRGFAEADVAAGRVRIAWLADGPYGIPGPAF